MSRRRFALSNIRERVNKDWRACVLGGLISFVFGLAVWLFLAENERARRAGLAIGGTLAGMVCIGIIVSRK